MVKGIDFTSGRDNTRMTILVNQSKNSVFKSVEFFPFAAGKLSFFHANPSADPAQARQWLSNSGVNVLAETQLDGEAVFVARMNQSPEKTLEALKEFGEVFIPPTKEKQFNPWKWRGNLSNIGQGLQLASSAMGKKGIDSATMGFSILNILANVSNIVFGAQKAKDENQLRFLKENFNEHIASHLTDDRFLPSPDDHRASLRQAHEPPKSLSHRAYEFMQRNSVRVGEIGLRYVGSLVLIFPADRWHSLFAAVKRTLQGEYAAAQKDFVHSINTDHATRNAGLAYVGGKSLALFAKGEDKYETSPKSFLDNLREKYLFKTSSVIELVAAGTLTYDRATNPNRKINFFGKETQDFLGAAGGAAFMSGLGIRLAAPYSTKQVDMKELSAHISDSLAHVPLAKLPQALADSAAFVKQHFKKDDIAFGKIFADVANDLYSYHAMSIITSPALPAAAIQPEVAILHDQPEKMPNFQGRVGQKNQLQTSMSSNAPYTSRIQNPASEGRHL